jgi:hypothetical protein
MTEESIAAVKSDFITALRIISHGSISKPTAPHDPSAAKPQQTGEEI